MRRNGGRDGFEYNLGEAPVAQWTEYLTSNQLVARSSRAGGANLLKRGNGRNGGCVSARSEEAQGMQKNGFPLARE